MDEIPFGIGEAVRPALVPPSCELFRMKGSNRIKSPRPDPHHVVTGDDKVGLEQFKRCGPVFPNR